MARSMPGAARLVLLLDAVFSAGRQAALVGQEKADDQTPGSIYDRSDPHRRRQRLPGS